MHSKAKTNWGRYRAEVPHPGLITIKITTSFNMGAKCVFVHPKVFKRFRKIKIDAQNPKWLTCIKKK